MAGLVKPKYEQFGYTHCIKDSFTSKVLSISTVEPEVISIEKCLFVWTNDPQNIKHVHVTSQQDFVRAPVALAASRPVR
jgi:hypothetical protein